MGRPAKKRKFSGQVFNLHSWSGSKTKAQQRKKFLKNNGAKVRVIPAKVGKKQGHAIYFKKPPK